MWCRTTPVITARSESVTSPSTKSPLRIAVVGVSSLIGEAVIDELRARKLPFAELHALDDERNVGAAAGEQKAWTARCRR